MNYEREELKISIPLIDDIELQRIDAFYNDIVSEYTKSFVKEKEQVIVQRLMMNLQQENSRLKEELEELKHKHYLIQGGRGNGKTYLLHLQQENKELKERIKNYEDPEDLTLMFMYCDEKAKDKIKELKEKIDKAIELNKQVIKDTKEFYRPTKDIIYSGDTLIDIAEQNLKILKEVE